MIKCVNECPEKRFEGCCFGGCPHADQCGEKCEHEPLTCGDSIINADGADEETALATFKETQIAVLKDIAGLVTAKKDLEAKEADLKVKLQAAMEAYGIKKFESDILNITYVAATTAETVDSVKLKKKFPDIAAQCMKKADRKAYVKVTLKGEK